MARYNLLKIESKVINFVKITNRLPDVNYCKKFNNFKNFFTGEIFITMKKSIYITKSFLC